MDKDFSVKLPNLVSGLALSFAAAEKGNSKAAKRAREAAYTEDIRDLQKSLLPKLPDTSSKQNGQKFSFSEKDTEPKTDSLIKNADSGKLLYDFSAPKPDEALWNVAKTGKMTEISNKQDGAQNNDFSNAFLTKELLGAKKNNNYQFNNVSDEQKKIYDIAEKENITAEHARIKTYAEKWKDVPEYKWTLGDILKWKTTGGDDYIHKKKLGFIKNYKDVILDAAQKYNIPPILLAGVAYVEYGGDPMWIDDVAYAVRSFDWSGPKWVDENLTITKNPDLTSFGNTSIQVRRALEMLGYDASSTTRKAVIDSLKDPIENIYLTACHLNILQNVDYKEKKPTDLTDDEIKVIASRYNLGPDIPLNDLDTGYGDRIYNNKDDILKALY